MTHIGPSDGAITRFWVAETPPKLFVHNFENRKKEEAEHFDVQKPLTIETADKERIGKVETGHHKMKVSAVYNIRNFKFIDWVQIASMVSAIPYFHFQILNVLFLSYLNFMFNFQFHK